MEKRDSRFIEYDKRIQKKIEEKFNQALPAAVLVCWISAFAIYNSPIPIFFVYLNFISGVIFLVLQIYKNIISTEIKIYSSILVSYIMGVTSFLDGAFNSAGIILILIANTIAVLLFAKKKSRIFTYISIVTFLLLWIYTRSTVASAEQINSSYWIIKFVVFLLFLLIFNVIVFSIRKYLIKTIFDLENSILKVEELAYFDQLTKLPNIYYMKKEWNKNKYSNIGLFIIVKLKDLRLINSIYGNKTGDRVLCILSKIMLDLKYESQIVSRFEGNEFAIWAPNIDNFHIKKWSEQVEKILKEELKNFGINYRASLLLGFTTCDSKNDILEDCLQKAELALTYAKESKQGDIVEFNQQLSNLLKEQEKMKDLIIEALDKKLFQLYYQTKIDITINKVIGVEALARWDNESKGFISPEIFVPLIESMNRYEQFGLITIDRAFYDYEKLCKKYENDDLTLAINISPSFLLSENFTENINQLTKKYDIDPNKVILEITEEVILQGTTKVNSVFSSLQKKGFKISLDDFGTGFSSLNYLIEYNIDELKIDKTFSKSLGNNDKGIILLESIEHLAKSYNLNIVIEGIETEQQLQMLKKFDFQFMQGYYFSHPKPL